MPIIIISFAYVLGYALAFCMLRIEQEADNEQYTKGDRAACIVLSLLSWLFVIGLLVAAWVRMIRESGYWSRPVNNEEIALVEGKQIQQAESLNDDEDE